jgi:hypothetical protein
MFTNFKFNTILLNKKPPVSSDNQVKYWIKHAQQTLHAKTILNSCMRPWDDVINVFTSLTGGIV